jgi:molybdopterin-guanine dinucleotide biosynthesis protein A
MKGAIAAGRVPCPPPQLARLSGIIDGICSEHAVICAEGTETPDAIPCVTVERSDELDLVKAALVWANEEAVLVAASDLQSPSAPLAEYLEFVRAGYDAVVPLSDDDIPQPLFAIYTPACLSAINSLLLSGRHSLNPLLEQINVRLVDSDEVAKFGDPAQILSRRSC